MNFIHRIVCKVLGHNWKMMISMPYEPTGTSKDKALVPKVCERCGCIPDGKTISELAQYEGKVDHA